MKLEWFRYKGNYRVKDRSLVIEYPEITSREMCWEFHKKIFKEKFEPFVNKHWPETTFIVFHSVYGKGYAVDKDLEYQERLGINLGFGMPFDRDKESGKLTLLM